MTRTLQRGATPTLDTPVGVRDHLVRALEAELVGPWSPDGRERLPLPPTRWYLGGFIAPIDDNKRDSNAEFDEVDDADSGDDDPADDGGSTAAEPAIPRLYPSSIGLTVLVAPGTATDHLEVTVRWADYTAERRDNDGGIGRGSERHDWVRVEAEPQVVRVPLDPVELARGRDVAGAGGLRVEGLVRTLTEGRGSYPAGTRAVSVFVVNRRPPTGQGVRDAAFAFQVGIEVRCAAGFVPRSPPVLPNEWESQLDDLQFRDRRDYAVGHGVATTSYEEDGRTVVSTTWMPTVEVRRIEPSRLESVELRMDALASTPRHTLARVLEPLAASYRAWIAQQRALPLDEGARSETRDELMERADRAVERIAAGIERLANDPEAYEAFARANEAMAMAARARSPERYKGDAPRWFPFQLAFVLLNVRGVCDDSHPDRDTVDLIFFPTGGGKTEAYLGVIAFTLLLRRLRGAARPDKGLGTAVILRYTLRLLTLDQLGRAATLCCALDLIRRRDPNVWGDARFAVGLWVGSSATPNRLSGIKEALAHWRNDRASSPLPLEKCPWCSTDLRPNGTQLIPATNPERLEIVCDNRDCTFSRLHEGHGLPLVCIDEQIYRELPAFVVATVDKFAMLPWRGEAGALFGKVHSRHGDRFAGPAQSASPDPAHTSLPNGLRPPELIVQDELHLISGPLGTMVGLFETAVDFLAAFEGVDGRRTLPKVIASTATVKRAEIQIKALFGRQRTQVFPPPGSSDGDSFFATRNNDGTPGRLYVGVAAAGRPLKTILLRVYAALLAANEATRQPGHVDDQPGDAYSTLIGYFNSLRELGGMRRLVEDDVRARARDAEQRTPLESTGNPWFCSREVSADPVELTSREKNSAIVRAKQRLGAAWGTRDHVDVALASNMISVGVDIDRLGLMVLAGQPKTTSEYIQATSRVGRNPKRPGLVITCYNLARPRDRSMYEDFAAFHASFYRRVEATSITPFSARAIERGLAGAIVSMVRHGDMRMTPEDAVTRMPELRHVANAAAEAFATRDVDHGRVVAKRAMGLLDRWDRIVAQTRADAGRRIYSPLEKGNVRALLVSAENPDVSTLSQDELAFRTPMSMRDVEPSVHLWVRRNRPLAMVKQDDDDE